MQFKNILLNLAVTLSALLFGLAWVGIYQFFVGKTVEPKQETILLQHNRIVTFDINDAESVLPLDFEEDKLSDPKADENNPEYFDPEGTYFVMDKLPSEFGSFESFTISNKTMEFDGTGNYEVENVSPEGFVFDSKKHEFNNVEIKDGKINFQTKKTATGVSFSFDGYFLYKGNFYTLDENS